MSDEAPRLILQPVPTPDPDDPLNWTTARKALNYGLVCFYVLWTLVQLDIGFTAWGPLQQELMLSVHQLNASAAMNYCGLAVGCIFFIPLVHKYGRRSLYLISSVLQLISVIWLAKTNNLGDYTWGLSLAQETPRTTSLLRLDPL